jgi:tetratricopeptide (TPR) repeat protein
MVASIFLLSINAIEAQGQTSSDTAQAIARTAEVLASEGQHDEAIAMFKLAYGLELDSALLYNLGSLHDRKGDIFRGREYYGRYISDGKDQYRLAKVRQRLQDVLDRIPGTLVIETDTLGAIVEVGGKPWAASVVLSAGPVLGGAVVQATGRFW